MKTGKNTILKSCAIALALSVSAVSVVAISATPAVAGPGNGKGNGNGNGNNGRGNVARELGSLNAAHANQRALERASPNSMPGKLYIYQQAQGEVARLVEVQDETYAEYQRLIGLSEEEIAAQYPEGGYEDAVSNAALAYEDARDDVVELNDGSLAALTGGRELSDDALAELARLLGLN